MGSLSVPQRTPVLQKFARRIALKFSKYIRSQSQLQLIFPMNLQDSLSQFSRHTPRLLRRQLVLQLTEQYLGKEKGTEDAHVKSCVPSIQRFHGALLQLEVLGLSILSMNLGAEELKNLVNEYFTKILETVDRHGGDVVKLSGDVFLVVWENPIALAEGDSKESDDMTKAAVTKATACAQEISGSCSHHRVVLGGDKSVRSSSRCTSPTASPASTSVPHSWQDGGAVPKEAGAAVVKPKQVYDTSGHRRSVEEEDEVFLNIRMAISAGLMAGIDVGSDNRWEYFLIGEPLSKVAEAAEGAAASGEVVLCADSHALLHPAAGAGKISRLLTRVKSALLRTNSSLESGGPRKLSCGCSQLKTGHCAVPPAAAPSPTKPRQLRKARTGTSNRLVTEDTAASAATALLDATHSDVEEAFQAHLALFSEEFTRLQVSLGIVCDAQGEAGDVRLQSTFSKWAQRCLTDDLARHVHPVVRGEHAFADASRSGSYRRAVEEQLFSKSLNLPAPTAVHQGTSRSTSASPAPLSSPARLGPLRLWGTSSAAASPANSRNASPLTATTTTAPITFPTPSPTPRDTRESLVSSASDDDELAAADQQTSPLLQPRSVSRSTVVISPPRTRPRASTHDSPSTLPALLPRSTTASPAVASSPVVSRAPSVDSERDSRGSRDSSPAASFRRPTLNRATTVGTGSETSINRRALLSSAGGVGGGGRRDSSLLRSSLAHGSAAASRALAEVRAVTVLSLRIELPDVELLVDGTRRQKTGGGPRFLARTVNERCADQLLLSRFQSIVEAVNETFARFGGQLKQFVVEDKVARCEGTFGLRGSVSDDNATASLEAARAIAEDLRSRSLHCSIGIALGRAFCFVAGSTARLEYAVVGPAVQLSEHLVRYASTVGVLCDLETRQRDHTHGFLAMDVSPPRGFANSLDAFVPVFPESSSAKEEHLTASASLVSLPAAESDHVSPSGAAQSIESALVLRQLLKLKDVLIGGPTAGNQSRVGLHGREKEWKDLLEFLLTPLVTHATSFDNTTNVTAVSRPGAPVKPIFDHQLPSRSAGVTGTFGVGKSSLVASIVERLAVVTRCNAGCNIHLFKARLDNFRQEAMFGAWKPIIVAMMTRLYRIQDAATTKKRRKSLVVGTTAAFLELTRSVDYICSLLPAALEKYRPLFGFIGILPSDENLASLRLTLAEKVSRSVELLLAVIQLYVKKCRALAVLVLDNIHSIDRPSMCLLLEVCAATHGVVVLFAGRTAAGSHNALHELSSSLKHSDRHLAVDLPELSKEAISALVNDVFKLRKGTTSGHSVTSLCDKVFESSGGNPFYAYEIAKSASEHQNQTWDASLTAVHSIRVEEVICHRFDQLRGSVQSLLKMAAVACSNGLPVSLELLHELDEANQLLEDHNMPLTGADQNRTELAVTLHHVLGCESFLRVVGQSDPLKEVKMEAILEGGLSFEFAIPLEQSTIYGLLMEDQKHAIHERVASYQSVSHFDRATAADLQEEAHHWQGACVFGRAMTCYFRAYQAEGDAERRSGWLSRAYSIYLHRKENTELVPDPVGISLNQLSGMLDDTMHNSGQSSTHSDPCFNVVFTLERVFQIFNGDSDLLATGIEVLLAVADERTCRSEDAHRTQLLLEDALQYVLLTKQPFLLSTGYVSSVVNQVNVVSGGVKKPVVTKGEDIHFHLQDFWPLCFRVLSAYVLNDAQSSHVSVEYFRKVGFVAAQSIALAKRAGCRHYFIQALCVESLVFFKMGDVKKAMEVVGELPALYTVESSTLLIDTYGYDIVPCVFIAAASHLLLTGTAEVLSESLIQACLSFVRTSSHALSVAHCLLPLLAHLSYRRRYVDAYEMLTAFDKLARADAAQVDALLPRKALQLYFEWLSQRIALSHSSSAAGGRSPTGQHRPQSMDELQSSMNEVRSQKEVFGSGILGHHQHEIELVLADLWVLRASDASADAAKGSHSCGVHLAHVLRNKARGVAQHFFNKASAVKIALDMLSVPPEDSKDQCIAELRRVFSVSAVSDLTMEAHQSHLEALCGDLNKLQHLLFDAQGAGGSH